MDEQLNFFCSGQQAYPIGATNGFIIMADFTALEDIVITKAIVNCYMADSVTGVPFRPITTNLVFSFAGGMFNNNPPSWIVGGAGVTLSEPWFPVPFESPALEINQRVRPSEGVQISLDTYFPALVAGHNMIAWIQFYFKRLSEGQSKADLSAFEKIDWIKKPQKRVPGFGSLE